MKKETVRKEEHRLVIEGNSVYEIDLECMRKKQQRMEKENDRKEKRQRG